MLMTDGEVDEDGLFVTETSGFDAELTEFRGFELVAEQIPTESTSMVARESIRQ